MRVYIAGDTSNQIHFEAMMVSDQCAALVKEALIAALPGSPELAWVAESTEDKPIPRLYFEVCTPIFLGVANHGQDSKSSTLG